MKKVVGILTLVLVTVGVCSFTMTETDNTTGSKKEAVVAAKGINFSDLSFEKAKAEAKKTGKLIFIDAYASWCGPCKMMDRNTFSNEKVGEIFNERFINLKIDMEKSEDGPMLSRMFRVTAYPTFLWVDGDGKLIKRELGYKTPEQFITVVQDLK